MLQGSKKRFLLFASKTFRPLRPVHFWCENILKIVTFANNIPNSAQNKPYSMNNMSVPLIGGVSG